jgi:hypothetical protein
LERAVSGGSEGGKLVINVLDKDAATAPAAQRPAHSSRAAAGSAVAGRLSYRLPAGATSHVVADLEPDATYTVTTTAETSGVLVATAPGPGPQASPGGMLSFETP